MREKVFPIGEERFAGFVPRFNPGSPRSPEQRQPMPYLINHRMRLQYKKKAVSSFLDSCSFRRQNYYPLLTMAVLSRILQLSLGFLATVVVDGTPIARRGTIASDEIVGFAQTVPSGTVGDLYLAYKPYLYVYNGCVPFPAVDAAGDTK